MSLLLILTLDKFFKSYFENCAFFFSFPGWWFILSPKMEQLSFIRHYTWHSFSKKRNPRLILLAARERRKIAKVWTRITDTERKRCLQLLNPWIHQPTGLWWWRTVVRPYHHNHNNHHWYHPLKPYLIWQGRKSWLMEGTEKAGEGNTFHRETQAMLGLFVVLPS